MMPAILTFRLMGPEFQKHLPKYLNLEQIPRVFIHGNPHLDNYVRTFSGSGMVDFDRSRIGPYIWDVIRYLSSVILRGDSEDKVNVKKSIIDAFLEGYFSSFTNPDIYFPMPQFVKSIIPQAAELTMKNYLSANIKWAKRMRKSPLTITSKLINTMVYPYLKSRNEEGLLNYYEITEAGISEGSLGKISLSLCLDCQ